MKKLAIFICLLTAGMLQSCELQIRAPSAKVQVLYANMSNRYGVTTPGYPVGVFSVEGEFLGSAINANQFASLWNQNAEDAAIGALSPTANTSVRFEFKPKAGQPVPAVVGLRYFQFDLNHTVLDTFSYPEGSVVDFGDGVMQVFDDGASMNPDLNYYRTFGGVQGMYISSNLLDVPSAQFFLNNKVYVYSKSYLNSSSKTITIYHNDNDYYLYNDNLGAGDAGGYLTNLRGNLPIYTRGLQFTSTQQASFNTLSNVNLAEFRNNVEYFSLRDGGGSPATWFTNYNFGVLEFINLKGLDLGTVEASYGEIAKVAMGSPDIYIRYPSLYSFGLRSSQYSTDLSFTLINIKQFALRNDDGSLTPADYDRILIELDFFKFDTGGQIRLEGGTARTTASDAAVASLGAKGVTVTLTP